MPFLGDLGKAFNIETREAANIASAFALGGPGAAIAEGVKSVSTPLPSFVPVDSDVSARPAGVDSPQTVAPVSQTGQTGSTRRISPAGQGFFSSFQTAAYAGRFP